MYIIITVEVSEQKYSYTGGKSAKSEIEFEITEDVVAAKHLVGGIATLMQGTAQVALEKYAAEVVEE